MNSTSFMFVLVERKQESQDLQRIKRKKSLMAEEILTIKGRIIRETHLSWLVECHAGEIWLPKSQVSMTKWENHSTDSFDIPMWLAEQKELT